MLIMTLAKYRRRLQAVEAALHGNINQFGAYNIALRAPPLTIAPETFRNDNQFNALEIELAGLTLRLEPTAFISTNQFGAPAIENVSPVTAYANSGGTGDRTGSIVATSSSGLFGAGNISKLINGVTTTEPGGLWFNGFASSPSLKFDFGTPRVIDAFRWWQGNNSNHGSWKWQGSHDDTSYADIGGTFALDGPIGGGGKEHPQPAGNATAYRYYLLVQVSGFTNGGPDLYEIEFKIF